VRLVRSSLRLAFCVCVLGVSAACSGGGAAAPTPTVPPTTGSPAVPAPSPQRPPLASPAASPSAIASAATPTAAATEAGSQTYEVQSGDTLATIAQQFYSDSSQWRRIYDANADTIGSDPDKLKVGMKLTIPPKPS
jgi:nucleoid-associated protein YgaU